MSSGGAKALSFIFVAGLSWYAGIKFWQPLVIEQLRKDGNLRDDVYIRDTSDQPKSWQDLKIKVRETLHPELGEKKETNVGTEIDETIVSNDSNRKL